MFVMVQATAIRKLETCNIHFVQAARVDFLMGSTFHASQQYVKTTVRIWAFVVYSYCKLLMLDRNNIQIDAFRKASTVEKGGTLSNISAISHFPKKTECLKVKNFNFRQQCNFNLKNSNLNYIPRSLKRFL